MTSIQWMPAIIAALLPIVGIACSRYSFAFSEDGAVPDRWRDPGGHIELSTEILERGVRARARICSRVLFDIGGLLVVAGVLMGVSDAHSFGLIAPTSIAAYGILGFALLYGIRSIVQVWRDRRANAFAAFYVRETEWYYKQTQAIQTLYFSKNPMPFWSIFRRNWTGTIQRPTAEEVHAANEAAGGNPPTPEASEVLLPRPVEFPPT